MARMWADPYANTLTDTTSLSHVYLLQGVQKTYTLTLDRIVEVRSYMICARQILGDQIQKDEIGKACGTSRRED